MQYFIKHSKQALINFTHDQPIRLAATLSFITLFAIPPILIVITYFIGFIFGDEVANGKLFEELTDLIGAKGSILIEEVLTNFRNSFSNPSHSIIVVIIFIIAFTSFFSMLHNSINYIWRLRTKSSFLKIILDRVEVFVIIVLLGLLFTFSLTLDAGTAMIKEYIAANLPGFTFEILRALRFLVSFLSYLLTFAVIFKIMPDVHTHWNPIWQGAFLTAILFTIGKLLIRIGIGAFGIASLYGAAGSLVVFLLWVFYSALIFFYGVEYTKVVSMYKYKITELKKGAVVFEIRDVKNS